MEKQQVQRIHFTYVIGILIFFIIGLISFKFGQVPQLVEYITFALTLTSLTLALLAIIYSIVSGGRLNESLGSLDSVTKDVLSSTGKLSDVTNALDKKVANIPGTLKNMEEKTDMVLKEMQKNNMPKIVPKIEDSKKKKEVSSIDFESFVNQTSFIGKLALYTATLSKTQNKGFILDEIVREDFNEYAEGFLGACESLYIVNYTKTKEVIIVTDINKEVSSIIEKAAYDTANKNDKDKDKEHLMKFSWVNDLNSIKKYFENKN